MLPAGASVRIMQSLGGTYTVITDRGNMVRISGRDADAMGMEPEASPAEADSDKPIEELVWDQLKTIYDPEIPVNIVDLGLVYECRVGPLSSGGYSVDVQMTLTAPGCGMGDVLRADALNKIAHVPGVKHVNVEVVIDPPWDQSMMSEAAKLQLGMY
jgi:probable FeS assembly SUF system protein SufT